MRQAILNLPTLSCHAAKIHMTFNMKEIKTNNKKPRCRGYTDNFRDTESQFGVG